MPDYRPGDRVDVVDTAAQKTREGYVRRTFPDGRVDVFILRYKAVFHFDSDGTTPRGRFLLKEAR